MKKLLVLFTLVISIPALAEKMTGYISDDKCAASGSKAAKATDWINRRWAMRSGHEGGSGRGSDRNRGQGTRIGPLASSYFLLP